MKKEITVDKALIRYNQINNVVIFIAIIALIVAFVLTVFTTFNYFSSEITAGIIFFLAFSVYAVLFGVFIIVLSPTFPIWKFWAFSRVSNVHELKKRLIMLGHISEENKFFQKIENSTENDQKYWKIRLKFAQEDIFVDDKTVPDETFIYYSKKMGIIMIMLMIPLFAYGILLLFIADVREFVHALFGIFFMINTAVIGYFFGCKKLINRKPQLILDNKGIHTKKTGFHKWEDIEKCIISTGNKAVLSFTTYSNGTKSINIQELNIKNNGMKLSKLLFLYRERNKLQNNRKSS